MDPLSWCDGGGDGGGDGGFRASVRALVDGVSSRWVGEGVGDGGGESVVPGPDRPARAPSASSVARRPAAPSERGPGGEGVVRSEVRWEVLVRKPSAGAAGSNDVPARGPPSLASRTSSVGSGGSAGGGGGADSGAAGVVDVVDVAAPVAAEPSAAPPLRDDPSTSSLESLKSDGSAAATIGTASDSSSSDASEADDDPSPSSSPPRLTLPRRHARSVARRPCVHLFTSLVFCTILTAVVVRWGNLGIDIGTDGMMARGTDIADRYAQARQGWRFGRKGRRMFEKDEEDDEEGGRRRRRLGHNRELEGGVERRLDYETFETDGEFCRGTAWYESDAVVRPNQLNLNSIWKVSDADPSRSALDADALHEMCLAQEETLRLLEDEDLCYKCDSQCLQPVSLVGFARVFLNLVDDLETYDGHGLDLGSLLRPTPGCDELRSRWTSGVEERFASLLVGCTNRLLERQELKPLVDGRLSWCPDERILTATVVDHRFAETGRVAYTSTFYATRRDGPSVDRMYELENAGRFPTPARGEDSAFEGARYETAIGSMYATSREGFYERRLYASLPTDAKISGAALAVTTTCILLHTRSPFITLVGLFQILFALPVAYFVYYFVFGLTFFPFINGSIIFVVFALGADDIFVAADKWKMKRLELPPNSTTEQVAVAVLPDIVYATFVTSITTAVAFFATAVMKIPAIALFAIYAGLVITADYILCILLVLPALCIYDGYLANGSKSCWWSLRFDGCRKRKCYCSVEPSNDEECNLHPHPAKTQEEADGGKKGRLHRILSFHYAVLHRFRWSILLSALIATGWCTYVAFQFPPPDDLEPPFLPQSDRYETHRMWAKELQISKVKKPGEGIVQFIWGLVPSDDSYIYDKDDKPNIVFDPTFDASSESNQVYLLGLCDKMFNGSSKILEKFSCPMEEFDYWLSEQSQSSDPNGNYTTYCGGADSVPVDPQLYYSCIDAFRHTDFADHSNLRYVEGVGDYMSILGRSKTKHNSPYREQAEEWRALEAWSEKERLNAPEGTENFFQVAWHFMLYDTIRELRTSTWISSSIAMACAGAMILLTSQSATVMVFAVVSIGYVLVATSASLVGLGWTLGFLESLLYSMVIGIGCDFVLHFGHAYTSLPGTVCKERRTQHALLHMGPSVLGSGFTTLSTALIMLSTYNAFSRKLATMLALTILHSTIGSFVIFLALCDSIGPSSRCSRWPMRSHTASTPTVLGTTKSASVVNDKQ